MSTNQVKFVICERLHEGGSFVPQLLSSYADTYWVFVDGDPDCFDPKDLLMFEQYEAAETIVNLAWDFNKVYLGIAIWESDHPNEIEYRYVGAGKDKNLQVKQNREEA